MKLPAAYTPYKVEHLRSVQKPDGYMRFVSRDTSITREEVYITWLLDAGVKGFFLVPNGKSHDAFVEEASFRAQARRYAEFLADNWVAHLARYQPKMRALIAASRRLAAAAKSGRGLLAAYDGWLRHLYGFCEFIWSPWAMIYAVEPDVIAALPQEVDCIMTPHAPNEYLLMRRDLHCLESAAWVRRYAWVNVYNPHDEPFTGEDYLRLRAEVKKNDVAAELTRLEKNEQRFRKLLLTITDAALRRKVVMVHTYSYLRTDRIDTWRQAMFFARPIYKSVAERLDVPLKATTSLAAGEVRAFLAEGTAPKKMEIMRRIEGKAYFFLTKGKIRIVAGGVEGMLRHLIGAVGEAIVRGTVACPGMARGRACIVTTAADLAKVRPGDIFIANFTFPTYTQAMTKAAAIVTNEGGIISHAAIISRECRIPCVVGTGKATETFKDGDLVEVDAKQGTVRKVKE